MTVRGVRTSDINPNSRRSQTAEKKSPCSRAGLLLDKQTPGGILSKGLTKPDLIVSRPKEAPQSQPKMVSVPLVGP